MQLKDCKIGDVVEVPWLGARDGDSIEVDIRGQGGRQTKIYSPDHDQEKWVEDIRECKAV